MAYLVCFVFPLVVWMGFGLLFSTVDRDVTMVMTIGLSFFLLYVVLV